MGGRSEEIKSKATARLSHMRRAIKMRVASRR